MCTSPSRINEKQNSMNFEFCFRITAKSQNFATISQNFATKFQNLATKF